MREIVAIVKFKLCDDNEERVHDILDEIKGPRWQNQSCGCVVDVIKIFEVKQ